MGALNTLGPRILLCVSEVVHATVALIEITLLVAFCRLALKHKLTHSLDIIGPHILP